MRQLTIQHVTDWHTQPQTKFLKVEEAICYILALTLDSGAEGTYGTGLINSAPEGCVLSDTVLYAALKFLLEQKLLTVKTIALPGRGRPRNVYKIERSSIATCKELAKLSKVLGTH
jgi:DNA-binding PadR family transcriptional regulator